MDNENIDLLLTTQHTATVVINVDDRAHEIASVLIDLNDISTVRRTLDLLARLEFIIQRPVFFAVSLGDTHIEVWRDDGLFRFTSEAFDLEFFDPEEMPLLMLEAKLESLVDLKLAKAA